MARAPQHVSKMNDPWQRQGAGANAPDTSSLRHVASSREAEAELSAKLDSASVELSARRTGMSFQRTRMSADRTLMSVIRTSLALITFGFTIYQLFEKVFDPQARSSTAAAHDFGRALVALGIVMLVLGIAYHIQFMVGLRATRKEMAREGLIYGRSLFPPSLTLITAVALLVIGLLAIASMVYDFGPFG